MMTGSIPFLFWKAAGGGTTAVRCIRLIHGRGAMARLSAVIGQMPGGTTVTGSQGGLTDIEGE